MSAADRVPPECRISVVLSGRTFVVSGVRPGVGRALALAGAGANLAPGARTAARLDGGAGSGVNGVYLGPVLGDNRTGGGAKEAAAAGIVLDEWRAAKAAEPSTGHLPTPEACAAAVVFLLSELAAVGTGRNIAVNGGQWMTQ